MRRRVGLGRGDGGQGRGELWHGPQPVHVTRLENHVTDPRLHVDVREEGDTVVLAASGEIDAHTSTTLDAAVDQALAAEPKELVIDLGDVPFMDSMGIRVLVRAQRAVDEADGSMRITRVSPAVARALDYAGLTEHLTVEGA